MHIDNVEDQSYDTLNPAEALAKFNAFLRDVVSRYEGNERERTELEKKQNDILHYIELNESLSASDGFKIYKKLREVRNNRRKLKKENEVLQPLYEYVKANKKLENDMNMILGKVRASKNRVDSRSYVTRTDILEETINEH